MNLAYAKILARELLDQHGLSHWELKIGKTKRAAGRCWSGKQIIELSVHHVTLNSEAEVRDTILHEIAHALAGHSAGHGPAWERMCVIVGARPERCYSSSRVVVPERKYAAVCGKCEKRYTMDRKSKKLNYFCRPCAAPLKFLPADFERGE